MTHSFRLQYEVKQALPLVRGLLTDLRAFGDLHPRMEKVESQGQGRYRIHEFKPVLGLRWRFHYEATVYIEDDAIVYDARPKGMRILLRFTLQPQGDGQTRVIEDVSLSGFPLLIPVLKKAICIAHRQVFQAMAGPHNPV
jgi:hypothetical protein